MKVILKVFFLLFFFFFTFSAYSSRKKEHDISINAYTQMKWHSKWMVFKWPLANKFKFCFSFFLDTFWGEKKEKKNNWMMKKKK